MLSQSQPYAKEEQTIGDMDNFMVAETWLHEATIEGQFVRKMPKVLFLLVGGFTVWVIPYQVNKKKSGPFSINLHKTRHQKLGYMSLIK